MEDDILEGEWNEVIEDSRVVWELLEIVGKAYILMYFKL